MQRPAIKDNKVLKYVENLESQLQELSTENTVNTAYYALKNFIETNSNVLKTFKLTQAEMSDKDDKIAERGMKFAKELRSYVDDLEKLKEKISPNIKSYERKLATKRTADRHVTQ